MRLLPHVLCLWAVLPVLPGARGLAAQDGVAFDQLPQAARIAMDTVSLGHGPYSEAVALLERTILRIDVARLRVRFGVETAVALETLLVGRRASAALANEAASMAIRSQDAWASLRFERDVGFDRFLDGIRNSVEAARRAGLVDSAFAEALSAGFPLWYSSLEDRGIREGDLMMYRIRGDTLRTVFQTVEGSVVVDQVDVASQARLAVLGGFLAPGSDFREGLLRSLLEAGNRETP